MFSTDWSNTGQLAYKTLGKERADAEIKLYPDPVRRSVKVSLSPDIPRYARRLASVRRALEVVPLGPSTREFVRVSRTPTLRRR